MGIFLLGMAVYVGRYRVASGDDLRVVLSGEPEGLREKVLRMAGEVAAFYGGRRGDGGTG